MPHRMQHPFSIGRCFVGIADYWDLKCKIGPVLLLNLTGTVVIECKSEKKIENENLTLIYREIEMWRQFYLYTCAIDSGSEIPFCKMLCMIFRVKCYVDVYYVIAILSFLFFTELSLPLCCSYECERIGQWRTRALLLHYIVAWSAHSAISSAWSCQPGELESDSWLYLLLLVMINLICMNVYV